MTDAREIIAQEFRRAHRDTCYPDATTGECEIAASAIVAALEAAGIRFAGPDDRILGPDEVDPVTLEKAAEAAENASIRVSYGILSQERDEPILHRTAIASLIRALGRKV